MSLPSALSRNSAFALSRAPIAAFVAVGLTWGSIAALAPDLKARIGADDATFGLLLLGTSIGLSTTLWAAPRWDRRMGGWALPIGTLLLAVTALGPGWAAGPLSFFVAMAVLGAASGLTDVVMNARVSEIELRAARSLMNLNHAMFSVAYAVSALLTGQLREAGLTPDQIMPITAALVAATALLQRMPVAGGAEGPARSGRLPARLVAVAGGIVLIAFMTEATVESWSALHIERTLGGRAVEGALGPAMLGLTMAVGRFSGQAVAARLSETRVIVWATGLAIVGILTAATAPVPALAYLGFGLTGLGISVIGPMGLALAGRLAPAGQRTGVIARVAIIGFLGFFIAPALMGLGAEALGLRAAFALVTVVLLGIWALLPLLR